MVDTRTHALAVKAGRIPPYVVQTDYEQAKRELTGETDPDRQLAVLDSNEDSAEVNQRGPTPFAEVDTGEHFHPLSAAPFAA